MSLALAALAMVFTVAIPWLTGRAIDQARAGERADLTTLALVVAAAGVLRGTVPKDHLYLGPDKVRPLG